MCRSAVMAYPHTPQVKNLKTENSLALAFCGVSHSEQVLFEFGQKVSLKSLAYANLDAPRHDIENVRSKKNSSKYVKYWRGAKVCPSCQPSREKTFCAELP